MVDEDNLEKDSDDEDGAGDPLLHHHVSTTKECLNCLGTFRSSTMKHRGRLCTNCFKIFESITNTALKNGGTSKLLIKRPGRLEMELTCDQNHTWKLGMHSRKAKNWCKVCKDKLRVDRRRQQLEEMERLHQQQLHQQQLLLEEAKLAEPQVEETSLVRILFD